VSIEDVLRTVRQASRNQRNRAVTGIPERRKAQEIHARRRLFQRYKVEITTKQYLEFCRWIQLAHKDPDPRASFVRKMNHRLSKWLIIWGDHRLFCVYDKKRNRIATFLAPDME